MRNTMKKTLAALACLALLPTTAVSAGEIRATFPGTLAARLTSAVVVSTSQCNYWGAMPGLVGSLSWNVTINTTGIVCYGSGSGTQNEVKHTFSTGVTFRQWHFIKTASSYDRTCDRCEIGNIGGTGNVTGPRARYAVDKYGTGVPLQYPATPNVGDPVNGNEVIAYF